MYQYIRPVEVVKARREWSVISGYNKEKEPKWKERAVRI